VPWSSFHPDHNAMDAKVEQAKRYALDALTHPDLAQFAGYDWVMITWTTP
jgi:hypothetical protein